MSFPVRILAGSSPLVARHEAWPDPVESDRRAPATVRFEMLLRTDPRRGL